MTDPSLDALERSLMAVVRVLAHRGTASDIAERSGYALPAASWSLLDRLDTHGSHRVSDLAACHGVDISSVTPRIKRLEEDGLIERERVPADGRASMIVLSGRGRDALGAYRAIHREILREALVDVDPRQWEALAESLGSMAAHLTGEAHVVDDSRQPRDA